MGNDISKLSVQLTANASGMVGGLKGGQNAMNALGDTAKRVGGILSGLTGVLGGIGIGFSLWQGFAKAGEAEQSMAVLDSVIRSTGQAAGFTSEEMKKMAGELASVTTFSKGAIAGAETVLATFTNIRGDQFKQAMTAAANLSTVLGTDLKGSAIQLGKALNDPTKGITALARAGVSFTQQQKDTIKALQETGDIVGAQKIVLAELNHEFGGAAEAAGQTFSAQLDKAKGALQSITTVIAEGMMPALTAMARMLKVGADWAKAHKTELHALGKGILTVITAIAAYKTVMFAITSAQKAWNTIQAITLALQGPRGWAMLGAAAVVAGVAYVAINKAQEKANDSMKEADKQMAQARVQMAGIAEEGEQAGDGIDAAGKSAQKLANDVASLTERLKEQIATFGMSSHEAEVYKLKMQGATDAQLAQANALAIQLEGLEAEKKAMDERKKAWEEWAKDAARIVEDLKDPYEKLEDELSKINNLEKLHLLSADQAARASEKAAEELIKSSHKGEKHQHEHENFASEKIGALERRFTRGFTAESTPLWQKMLKENQRQSIAGEATARNTAKIAGKKPPEIVSL